MPPTPDRKPRSAHPQSPKPSSSRPAFSKPSSPKPKRLAGRPYIPAPSHVSPVESRKAVTGDKARDLVCQRLAQQARRFPDLDPTGFDARLEARDLAFAHKIYDAVIRRWLTLDALIRSRLDKPDQRLDMGVQAALMSGLAQMLLLDRVPTHSAINHSVEWTKHAVSAKAGGLVNAVLRRLGELLASATNAERYTIAHDEIPLEDGGALKLTAPIFRGDPLERLAAATSHPAGFLRAVSIKLGQDAATALALHSLVRPPTTLCTAYAATAEIPGALPHREPSHRIWTGERPALLEALAADRRLWVQDASSSRAVLGLSGRLADLGRSNIQVVVDLCAGQGTKSRQLSAEFAAATILASDTDDSRMDTLRSGAATTGGRIRAVDATDIPAAVRGLGGADLVLLDVPCSNAGTLARRPEAKYRLASDQWARLIPIQREILRAGAALLKADGVLVYSTCSIDPAENHEQALWAADTLGLRLHDEEATLPAGAPGDPESAYRDGSYWAILTPKSPS